MDTRNSSQLTNICLVTQLVFDGSSGHSSYKKACNESEAIDSPVSTTSINDMQRTRFMAEPTAWLNSILQTSKNLNYKWNMRRFAS